MSLRRQRIPVTSHRFDWVRRSARPIAVPGNRVLLGSALLAEGRIAVDRYLRWVSAEAFEGPLVYLPHRRETAAMRTQVAAISGVRVYDTGLPVELVLAGAQESLEVITLPTNTRTALTRVLAGTGSTIRTRAPHREAR